MTSDRPSAEALLKQAAAIYDADPELRRAARAVAREGAGFTGGGRWMALALGKLRGVAAPTPEIPWERWGFFKYGLCTLACAPVLALCVATGQWAWALLMVVAFYAIEAQMVFLFPVLLDQAPEPLSRAREHTVRAGGTWRVMRTVWVLAAVMIFGGLAGRGFVRSWCLGCLAVAIWYELIHGRGAWQTDRR